MNKLAQETNSNPQLQTLTNLSDFLRHITHPRNEHYQSMLTLDQKVQLYATTLQAFTPTLDVPFHPTRLPPRGMAMASIYRAGKLLYSSTDLRLDATYEVFYIQALLLYKDSATARDLFESRLLKGENGRSLCWLELGVKIYWKCGFFKQGVALLETIEKLFDGYVNPVLIQLCACMFLQRGQITEAYKWFRMLRKSVVDKGMVSKNRIEYVTSIDDAQLLWDRFNKMYHVSHWDVIRCVISCFKHGLGEMAVDLIDCAVNADFGFLEVLMRAIDKKLYYFEKESLIYQQNEDSFKKSNAVQLIIEHLNQKRNIATQSMEEVEVLKKIINFLKTCSDENLRNSIQHKLKYGDRLTIQQTEDLIWLTLRKNSKERFVLYNKIMSELKKSTSRLSELQETGMFPPLNSGHYLRAIQAISRVKTVPIPTLKKLLENMNQWEIPMDRRIANHLILLFTRGKCYEMADQLILSFFEDGYLKKSPLSSISKYQSDIEIESDYKILTRLFNTCLWSYNKMTQSEEFTPDEFHSRQQKLREMIRGFLRDSEGYFDDASLYCSIEALLSGNDEACALALLQYYGTVLERGIPITVLMMIQRKILFSLNKMIGKLSEKNLKLMQPQFTRIREACELISLEGIDDGSGNGGVILATEGNMKGREEDAGKLVHWTVCAKLIITYMKELRYYPFPYSFQDSTVWSFSSSEIFELKKKFEFTLIERQSELGLTEMDIDAMLSTEI
ncbi:unnamed protein product [Ambrosiozyma monospora]|uniref:Unnamed protein product n=1 Tax=Ambrosiozyma monospora TaxID=43982 RepID=A0ACB5T665_AMBMO|nr:unnamed protein product [Ambrosiozyma monospora]